MTRRVWKTNSASGACWMPEFIHEGNEKKSYVQEMFNDISGKYDFLNHLLSFGMDYFWRRRVVKSIPADLKGSVLDVATGTGDLAIMIRKNFPEVSVTGLDYAFGMLRIAKQKAIRKGLDDITMIQGDGEDLPFKDKTFSALTIAFGFRNIGHYDKALAEFHRVVKRGGSVYILEFSEPESPLFRRVYKVYFNHILPKVGALFSRSDAYRYLPESVEHFPSRSRIRKMMEDAGFAHISITGMNGGTVTLIQGKVT